jgi:hypothetical protein
MTMLLDIHILDLLDTEWPQAERSARQDMRAQIARLEARGVTTPAASSGPRLLTLGELEALRDAMSATLYVQSTSNVEQMEARQRFEAMVADPARHRRDTVSLAEMGLPGCGTYRVKPRLGLVGMLAGWWEITLSSGCP